MEILDPGRAHQRLGDVQLGLRLYDMPGIGGAVKLGADDLPSIERLECRP